MLSAFLLWGAGQLEVWLWRSWPMGSSLTSSQRWSHGFKWWGCSSFLERGLSGVCPRGGMLAQGACGQAKPSLSLPQTSPSCLAPLFGALCPPEQVKGNARHYSPPGPSGEQGCLVAMATVWRAC